MIEKLTLRTRAYILTDKRFENLYLILVTGFMPKKTMKR